jgi:hypothetical protein
MYSIYVYKYTKQFIVEKQPVGVNETLVQTCTVSIDICEQNWNFKKQIIMPEPGSQILLLHHTAGGTFSAASQVRKL